MYISFECCLSFAEVHFGSINLQKESFNKHFFSFPSLKGQLRATEIKTNGD